MLLLWSSLAPRIGFDSGFFRFLFFDCSFQGDGWNGEGGGEKQSLL